MQKSEIRADFAALAPISAGGAAVITGAASGIGLAAACRFAELGMAVVLGDLPGERLAAAEAMVKDAAGHDRVAAVETDVARTEDLARLRDVALDRFGHVGVLMNNAGIGLNPGSAWKNPEAWRTLIGVNLWGVIGSVQAFLPAMIAAQKPAFVVNTGSKQGITSPPGNGAYNVSKAALKTYTETLQHELRNTPECGISAHLLIPGFTFTGITAQSKEKPSAAWTAAQVVDFMLASLRAKDFYILCPDNDVARPVDERRIQWAADDLIKNRPALSRWHPDYADEFAAFMKVGQE